MPLIERSSFPGAPFWQYNGHLQTLVPGIMRRVEGIEYARERIETPDGDFLDLDWITNGNPRLLIITHGLEGNSTKQYVMGAAKLFSQHGYDVLAWNCRSCSGEMNKAFRMYHHGDTDDISAVVDHALGTGRYHKVVMTGYSMGANITLKYLGTRGEQLPVAIKAAAVFSAPCDLRSGAEVLDRWDNSIYRRRFLKALTGKMHAKSAQYPGRIDVSRLPQVKRWRDFDEWFSAPVCGYRDADDFYTQASARHFIDGIRIPTLLANAANDPILTPECMPQKQARKHDFFHFEMSPEGGHCGFQIRGNDEYSWSERRSLEFCDPW